MRHTLTLIHTLLIFLFSAGISAQQTININDQTKLARTISKSAASTISEELDEAEQYRPFYFNPQLRSFSIMHVGSKLALDFFDDKQYTATVKRVNRRSDGMLSITTQIDKENFAYCYIIVSDAGVSISAHLPLKHESYTVGGKGKESYLSQYDPRKLKEKNESKDCCALVEEPKQEQLEVSEQISRKTRGESPLPPVDLDEQVTINLIIAYTAYAKNSAASAFRVRDIEHAIELTIQEANTVMENSRTGVELKVVHSFETDYLETNDGDKDVYNAYGITEAKRREYGADLCILLLDLSKSKILGGATGIMNPVGDPRQAHAVVNAMSTFVPHTEYVFIHEVGHLFGCGHDRQSTTANNPMFDYSYGWYKSKEQAGGILYYNTIMSYARIRADVKVPYFSSPDILVDAKGETNLPIGDEKHNNALTIKRMKHAISKYHSHIYLNNYSSEKYSYHPDPDNLFNISYGNWHLKQGDVFSATRVQGEDPGDYPITRQILREGVDVMGEYEDIILYLNSQIPKLQINKIPIRVYPAVYDDINADYYYSKVYGDSDPDYGPLYIEFPHDVNEAYLPENYLTGNFGRVLGEDVGRYRMNAGTVKVIDDKKFELKTYPLSLYITARPITIRANNLIKGQGASDPELTYTITNGSRAFSDQFTGQLERVAGETQDDYTISLGSLSLGSNYDITFEEGIFSIGEGSSSSIDLSLSSFGIENKAYDGKDVARIVLGSLVGIETGDEVSLDSSELTARFADKDAGENKNILISGELKLTGADANKYTLIEPTYFNLKATISKSPLELKANNQSMRYGTDPSTIVILGAYTALGFVNNEGKEIFTRQPQLSIATSVTISSNVGSYAGVVNIEGAESKNYTISYRAGDLVISTLPGEGKISFSTIPGKIYGDKPFTLSATHSGNEDVYFLSDNSSLIRIDDKKATVLGAGTVKLRAKFDGNQNISGDEVEQTITIAKANVTISLSPKTTGYTGNAISIDSPNLIGGTPSDILSYSIEYEGVNGTSYPKAAIAPTNAGEYKVIVSTDGDSNHNRAEETTTLEITKASLRVTAKNQSMIYGTDPGSLNLSNEYTIAGFVNNENESVLDALPSLNIDSSITNTSAVNDYPGVVLIKNAEAKNYTITHLAGDLKINILPGSSHINFPSISNKVYGNPVFDLTASHRLGKTLRFESSNSNLISITNNKATIKGAGIVSIKAVFDGDVNVGAEEVEQTITIAKADVTISLSPKTMGYTGNAISIDSPNLIGGTPSDVLSYSIKYEGANGTSYASSATAPTNAGEYKVTISTDGDQNHHGAEKTTSLKITKASLLATAKNQSMVYGTDPGSLNLSNEYTITGFVNNENESVLDILPSLNIDSSITSTSSVNDYQGVVLIKNAEAKNYTITHLAGDLKINILPGSGHINFSPIYNKVYGDAVFDLTANHSLGKTLRFESSNSNLISITNNKATIKGTGTVRLKAIFGGDVNVGAEEVVQTITIAKANVTISLSPKTGSYAGVGIAIENPILQGGTAYEDLTLNISYEGINGTSYAKTTTAPTNTGEYKTVVSTDGDVNHHGTEETTSLKITKASLRVTAKNQSMVYGTNPGSLNLSNEYTITGFVNNENESVLDVLPSLNIDSSITSTSPVNDYPGVVLIKNTEAKNYTITHLAGDLKINILPGSGHINFSPISNKVYGNPVFDLTANHSLGKTLRFESSNSNLISITNNKATIKGAGIVSIKAIFDGNGNEGAEEEVQTITIAKADVTISLSPKTMGYTGNAISIDSPNLIGGTPSDILSYRIEYEGINGTSYPKAAIAPTNAGEYKVIVSTDGDSNHNRAEETTTLEITKASLRVTAKNQNMVYGTDPGSLNLSNEYTITGFVNNENESVLDVLPSLNIDSSITNTSAVNDYPGVVLIKNTEAKNYTITHLAGDLKINILPGSSHINFPSISNKVYGNPVFDLTASHSLGKALHFESSNSNLISITNNKATIKGAGIVNIKAIFDGDVNVGAEEVVQTITIAKANVTISLSPKTMGYVGNPISIDNPNLIGGTAAQDLSFSIRYEGVNGTSTSSATAPTNAGEYKVTVSTDGDSNHNRAEETTTLEITKASLRVTAKNQNMVYGTDPGSLNLSNEYTITGFVNNENESVLDIFPDLSIDSSITSTSPVNDYQGVVLIKNTEAKNYTINHEAGDLKIKILSGGGYIYFPSIPNKVYGNPVFDLTANHSLGKVLRFESSNSNLISITNNKATIKGAGIVNIKAIFDGDNNVGVDEVVQTITIAKANVTISLSPKTASYAGVGIAIENPILQGGTADEDLTLNISYEGINGTSYAKTTTAPTNTGEYKAVVSTDGDVNHHGTEETTSLKITKTPLIVRAANQVMKCGTDPSSLDLSNGYTITGFVNNENEAMLEGRLLLGIDPVIHSSTIVGLYPGMVKVEGYSSKNYAISYTFGSMEVSINADDGLIDFPEIGEKNYGDVDFEVIAIHRFGQELDIITTNTDVISLNKVNNKYIATIVGAGSVELIAKFAGNTNLSPKEVSQTILVHKAEQTINFPAISDKDLTITLSFTLNATSSSGLDVNYESNNSSIAKLQGNKLDLLSTGTVAITASQPGNKNYNAAESVVREFQVIGTDTSIHQFLIDGEAGDIEEKYLVAEDNKNSKLNIEIVTANGASVSSVDESNNSTSKNFQVDISRPTNKQVRILVTSADGTVSEKYILKVEKRFDFHDIVGTKRNILLYVNNNPKVNGGYQFDSYKWYENNVLVGSGQYYYKSNNQTLKPQNKYHLELDTNDGMALRTWEGNVNLGALGIAIYPNPLRQGQRLNLEITGEASNLTNGKLSIYTLSGILVSQEDISTSKQIDMPNSVGTYVIRISAAEIVKSFKIIIH